MVAWLVAGADLDSKRSSLCESREILKEAELMTETLLFLLTGHSNV